MGVNAMATKNVTVATTSICTSVKDSIILDVQQHKKHRCRGQDQRVCRKTSRKNQRQKIPRCFKHLPAKSARIYRRSDKEIDESKHKGKNGQDQIVPPRTKPINAEVNVVVERDERAFRNDGHKPDQRKDHHPDDERKSEDAHGTDCDMLLKIPMNEKKACFHRGRYSTTSTRETSGRRSHRTDSIPSVTVISARGQFLHVPFRRIQTCPVSGSNETNSTSPLCRANAGRISSNTASMRSSIMRIS